MQDENKINMVGVETYLDERVNDQIEWYDRKSGKNQFIYKFLKVTTIILAVSIPFLTGFLSDSAGGFLKYVIGGFGLIVAIIESLQGVYKFHENWIQYRTTAESLKHHKYLFITRSGPYSVVNPFPGFVENIENLISKENSVWAEALKEKKGKESAQKIADR
mgnify:CR=1 FL=1